MSGESITIELPAKKEKNLVEFTGPNKIWTEQGDVYRLRDKTKRLDKLDNAVYTLEIDDFGFYLEKIETSFTFDYKLYGLETGLISRVIKTFNATTGNLGVLLNGVSPASSDPSAAVPCLACRTRK